jgi:hypothetical protein
LRRSALVKLSTIISVAAAFAVAPSIASAAAPPECSAPGAWRTISGSLSTGEMSRAFLPDTAKTRACLSVPATANFDLYLERQQMGTTNPWEIVNYSKGYNAYEWFDADTDRYADPGKLWQFRLRVVRVSGGGTYKLSWLGL